MAKEEMVKVAKSDLLAAWVILEELAVSFDQIGGAFGEELNAPNGEETRQAMRVALDNYLTPERVQAINQARFRIGQYLPDQELEELAEHKIPYWNYAGLGSLGRVSGKADVK